MKICISLVVAMLLAGCADREVARHERCLSLGFQSGTEGYGMCRLQIEQNAAAHRQANAAAYAGVMTYMQTYK